MKRLNTLLGKIERFFLQYTDYLSAKFVLVKYNSHPEKYDISKNRRLLEMLEDARLTVSLWEKGKTLDNYCKNQ